VNEEDGVEEDPEQIVEAGDEPANHPLRGRVGQLGRVLVEEDAGDTDEASAQDGGQVELSFAEWNNLKMIKTKEE
jgi:hypothetical protein